jgi:hypothetical protein
MNSVSDVGRTVFVPGQVPKITITPRAELVDDPVLRDAPSGTATTAPSPATAATAQAAADDAGYSFWDVLDLFNPLQHIPVVNVIYRELTGDTIKTPAKLVGATLLGGPIGFAAAMVDSMIAESTGKDLGGHVMAMLKPDAAGEPGAPPTQLADAVQARPQAMALADEMVDDPVLQPRPGIPASLPRLPDGARRAPAEQLRASGTATRAQSTAPREYVPQDIAQTRGPTEAEAQIAAARVAGQANVLGPLKRDRVTPGETKKVAQAQVIPGRGELRFMPLNRAAAEGRVMTAPTQRAGTPVSVGELKAQARFAPGPLNVGGAAMSPATLAAATAAQRVPAARTPRSTSAQERHDYGRHAAAGGAPAEMPGWFDDAMREAIDKYQAMNHVGAATK